MFRFCMWLFDLSGEKRKRIKREAVQQWKDEHLWAVKSAAIADWWENNKGSKKFDIIKEWCEARPIITVGIQKDLRDRYRCKLHQGEGDPIAISSGFGFENAPALRKAIGRLSMANIVFVELPPSKPKEKKPKNQGAKEKG